MNIAKIEEAVQDVLKNFSQETFIYELLAAYGKPRASITRLQKGNLNLSKIPGEIIWKKNLLFRSVQRTDLHTEIDRLRKSDQVTKHNLRFVIVTDYKTLLAADAKTSETLDIPIEDLPKYFDFFLPWGGQEKHRIHNESEADIKAAYRMARLYDEICKDNPTMVDTKRHLLNVFLSRLLFCFFAEDTGIFPKVGMFTSSIASHTQEDGSDLHSYLDKLFKVMNTQDCSTYPIYLQAFPYVNGGLFADRLSAPKFSRLSRKIIIECGELNWSEINPDIFGSMIQAVVHPAHRSGMGMHYTSVSNIMKVIEPLFLNELCEVFEKNEDSSKGLENLLERLYNIKIFDPACGSGNFLIIAYKELRKLEMQIYQRLKEINIQRKIFLPKIRLTQFYGIELDDFAHEIAVLSLWLAEHQMNVKFKNDFGQVVPALPLKESGHILCDNATLIDWETVCPKDDNSEVYILGNPPYYGSKKQTNEQKKDMARVFKGSTTYKNLDYIACWFLIASKYIDGTSHKCAFVSTNSITQGDQVFLLWPYILNRKQQIFFAHKTFTWANNAKKAAGVDCVIVGISSANIKEKIIFDGQLGRKAQNINPYLIDAPNIIVSKKDPAISNLPLMVYGNMPLDGGFLKLTSEERNELLKENKASSKFLKRLIGGDEFLAGIERWCLWIEDEDLDEALKIASIKKRIEKVREFRLDGGDVARTLVNRSHQFRYRKTAKNISIMVPRTSSENRDYLQCGFHSNDFIVMESAQVIYDSEPYIFGVLSSKMHMVWARVVAGRLRTDIRYSNVLCYNTFPIQNLSEKQKDIITSHVINVLGEREKHPEKTIAQLYDPDTMPAGLLQAHRDLDIAIDRCYRSKPFTSDEDRLEYLFDLYKQMTLDVQKEKTYA